MNADERRYEELTERIIGCAYRVSNELGCGFFENVYENAMVHELKKQGFFVEQQVRYKVFYDNVEVGEYIADLVVENDVLIELKAIKALEDVHTAQCINCLKATSLKICLLMNFGKPRVEIRRIVNNL